MTEGNGVHLGDLSIGVGFDFNEADLQRAMQAAEQRLMKKFTVPVGIDAQGLQQQATVAAQATTRAFQDSARQVEMTWREFLKGRMGPLMKEFSQQGLPHAEAHTAAIRQIGAEWKAYKAQAQDATKTASDGAAGVVAATRAANLASREQIAAARAAAAESAANTAKLKEQAAQLALSSRLSSQADREAARVARAAMQARREAIDGLRLDYSRLRTALDAMTISEAEFNQGGDQIIRKLKAMGDTAEFTARELKQLSDLEGRISREQNTLAGVVNPVGFSGNVVTALQGALPGILAGLSQVTQMSPSIGAAAAQVTGIAQGLSQVRVAAQGAAPQTLQLATGLNTSATAAGILRGGAAGAGGAVAGLGTAATAAGAAIGGLTIALAAGGAAANRAINEYSKLESALAKVSTLTDKMPGQLGGVGEGLQQFARDYGVSVEQLAAGLYDILGASVAGTEDMGAAMRFLEQATKLATAGATDASVATDVLTSVLNAYKLNASDAGTVSDKLFKTVDLGKVSFQQLAQSLGMVTAISSQAGVSLDEVLAALATMTANGVQASSAVDYLRSLISSIVGPSEKAAATAKELGINFNESALRSKGLTGVLQEVITKTGGSSEKMKALFGGVEAVTAATSIATGEFGRMNDSLRGIANSTGATETAYSKMADTLEKRTQSVQQGWKTLWQNIGEYFAPVKSDILNFMDDWLDKLNQAITRTNAARGITSIQDQINAQQAIVNNNAAERASILDRMGAAQGTVVAQRLQERLAKLDAQTAEAQAKVVQLRAQLTSAQAEAAQRNARTGALPGPNTGGTSTQTAVSDAQMAAESGKFGYAYISKLKDVFKNDPNVDSDCAVIATAILQNIGVKIKGSANAGTLERNAVAAGFTKVEGDEIKPGDLIVWTSGNGKTYGKVSGKHVGVAAGFKDGQLMVINNPGSSNTEVEPMYDRQNATVYRAPTSPFAAGRPGTGAPITTTPEEDAKAAKARAELLRSIDASVAAGRVAAAQRALTELKRIQADELAAAGDNAQRRAQIVQGSTAQIIAAEQRIARAVRDQAVAAAGAWAKEAMGKEGADAKAIETERVRRVREAYAVEAQARKEAVSDQARATLAAQAQVDKDAETRAKNRAATQRALQDALAKGNAQAAQAQLENLRAQQAKELDLARNSAVQRARIVRESGPAILAAETRIATLKRDLAVKEAQRAADEAKKLPGADLAAIEATRKEAVRQAYAAAAQETKKARDAQATAERAANRDALAAQQLHARESLDAQKKAISEQAKLDQQAYRDRRQSAIDSIQRLSDEGLNRLYDEGVANRDQVLLKAFYDEVERRAQVAKDEALVLFEIQAEGNNAVATTAQQTAEMFAQDGDLDTALQILTDGLSEVMDAAQRGEDAADAINKLVDAINNLTTGGADADAFNSFVAGLSGTLDEQIGQVVDKLDDPALSRELAAKYKALLASLRQQLPAWDNSIYASGLIPGANGFQNRTDGDMTTLDADAQARDMLARIEAETDPAALQGLLSDLEGFLAEKSDLLSSWVTKNIEEVRGSAQDYIRIMQDIPDTPVGDAVNRTQGAAGAPANQYARLNDALTSGQTDYSDPDAVARLTEQLQAARAAGELTDAQLRDLLKTVQALAAGPVIEGDFIPTQTEERVISLVTEVGRLKEGLEGGTLTLKDFRGSAVSLLPTLDAILKGLEASGQGSSEMAVLLRAARTELLALGGAGLQAAQGLNEFAKYAGYVRDLAGAFGKLADATGATDLGANLAGIANLAGQALNIATQLASGNIVGGIVGIVSGIADMIAGFQKANAEVAKLKEQFAADNPLLIAADYQKAFTRSRGFFGDLFGGGPEVVQELDEVGLIFAKSMQSGFLKGIQGGLRDAIAQNDFSLFSKSLKESVYEGILSGIVDAFLQDELIKNIVGPAIKAWSDALKTPDPGDDAAALAGIDAAISAVDAAASRFYSDVAPKLTDIQTKWGIDMTGNGSPGSSSYVGAAPVPQIGVSRVELSLPDSIMAGFNAFTNQAVPEFRSGVAEWRQATAEFRAWMGGRAGGPPPLSGNGGLV